MKLEHIRKDELQHQNKKEKFYFKVLELKAGETHQFEFCCTMIFTLCLMTFVAFGRHPAKLYSNRQAIILANNEIIEFNKYRNLNNLAGFGVIKYY